MTTIEQFHAARWCSDALAFWSRNGQSKPVDFEAHSASVAAAVFNSMSPAELHALRLDFAVDRELAKLGLGPSVTCTLDGVPMMAPLLQLSLDHMPAASDSNCAILRLSGYLPGGHVGAAEYLMSELRRGGRRLVVVLEGGSSSCSATTRLISGADFVIAASTAQLFYHGSRIFPGGQPSKDERDALPDSYTVTAEDLHAIQQEGGTAPYFNFQTAENDAKRFYSKFCDRLGSDGSDEQGLRSYIEAQLTPPIQTIFRDAIDAALQKNLRPEQLAPLAFLNFWCEAHSAKDYVSLNARELFALGAIDLVIE